jgi:Fe-S cluster assembly iron-binding protein IscA
MISITELAAEKLSAYLTDNKINSPIRISVMNSCGGASLALSLDERRPGDYNHEKGTVTLVIDHDLSQLCGRVTVDYIEKSSGCGCGEGGFSLVSEKPLSSSGGDCGSCSSCGC